MDYFYVPRNFQACLGMSERVGISKEISDQPSMFGLRFSTWIFRTCLDIPNLDERAWIFRGETNALDIPRRVLPNGRETRVLTVGWGTLQYPSRRHEYPSCWIFQGRCWNTPTVSCGWGGFLTPSSNSLSFTFAHSWDPKVKNKLSPSPLSLPRICALFKW